MNQFDTNSLRIGEAAAELGLASHVLRHWEDVGVLIAPRAPGGQREYNAELLTRARLILICQHAGMSLAEIANLFTAQSRGQRMHLISAKQAELHTHRNKIQRAIDFLDHVLTCRHPMVSECNECTGFSKASAKDICR